MSPLRSREKTCRISIQGGICHVDQTLSNGQHYRERDEHRIGQSRPVTIYRLVAANIIEEKILQLHTSKRDMADMLPEGTDRSVKLSTKDLMELLKSSTAVSPQSYEE